MKKLFFTAIAIVFITAQSFANSNEVSYKVLNQFKAVYTTATKISWQSNSLFTKASFLNNGKQMEVFYNPEGELIGTSESAGFSTLPAKAVASIAKRYPANGYTVTACIEFTNANDETVHYVSVENNRKKIVLEVGKDGNVSVFQTIIK